IYDSKTLIWTPLADARSALGTYPFMFVLPDGRVIRAGGSERATATDVLDVGAERWRTVDSRQLDGGSAVMYGPGRVMKSGTAAPWWRAPVRAPKSFRHRICSGDRGRRSRVCPRPSRTTASALSKPPTRGTSDRSRLSVQEP